MSNYHSGLQNAGFPEAPQPKGRRTGGKPAPKKQWAVDTSSGVPQMVEIPILSDEDRQALTEAAKPTAPRQRRAKTERVFVVDGTDIPHAHFAAIPVQKPAKVEAKHRYGHFRTNASIAQFKADAASRRLSPSEVASYEDQLREALLRRHAPKQQAPSARPTTWAEMSLDQQEQLLNEDSSWMSPGQKQEWVAAGCPRIRIR